MSTIQQRIKRGAKTPVNTYGSRILEMQQAMKADTLRRAGAGSGA